MNVAALFVGFVVEITRRILLHVVYCGLQMDFIGHQDPNIRFTRCTR